MRDILKKALPQADERALERFEIYQRLLGEWNERMNLTAITDPVEVAEKHFADSLAALPYLKPGMKVIDVGTGAGFPGVPLLIMEPRLDLTLSWASPPPWSTAGRRTWGRTGSIGSDMTLRCPGRWRICRCCWSSLPPS